ncbi:ESAT-6 protein secretion system EspG family protein [Prauserella shujinwangii]|uniref:ESAT-6 protein secretion system EspG family protein n=1 Tax=Prauserella shujinwangii TaxID=1453103 RepID=A0A2T0M1P1_9PSEU|nr:ESX secretion-associated protein EspG [Prauserella shujinwangii]PRX50522.1 ESAT-6 protein secretion system EspG family protein [Prauserella shujinwangii]
MPTQEFFTPVAFDFLWESARVGELPYPLRVRSHGSTETERLTLRQRAETEFAARRLADTPVARWIEVLARPTLSIDALHIPEFEAEPVAVLAATDGTDAVVVIQDADGVWLRPTYPDGLASTVVDLLPRCDRGSEPSVTLPLADAVRTPPARSAIGAGTVGGAERKARQRTALSERPADPRQAYAQLIAQPRLRGGQLAANSRDHLGGKRRSPVLAWFDTGTGRYLSLSRAGTDGSEWVTVSPADAKTLRTRLAEMLAQVAA